MGSVVVQSIRGPIVVSAVARVEVVSAIRRVAREVGDSGAGQVLEEEFLADWHAPPGSVGHLVRVQVRTTVLERAASIVGQSGLRSLDAIQLASALLAREADPGLSRFVTFDARLAGAAIEAGFTP